MDDVRSAISRRAVTRTALWSVPVVTLAAASPAFALSTDVDLVVSLSVVPDSLPGERGPEGQLRDYYWDDPFEWNLTIENKSLNVIPPGATLLVTISGTGRDSSGATIPLDTGQLLWNSFYTDTEFTESFLTKSQDHAAGIFSFELPQMAIGQRERMDFSGGQWRGDFETEEEQVAGLVAVDLSITAEGSVPAVDGNGDPVGDSHPLNNTALISGMRLNWGARQA